MARENNIRREFSYTRPILYNGESYPSADTLISDENGNKTKGTIFADANGQYFTLDRNRNAIPVMPVNELAEVTVSAPRGKNVLADAFGRYLTMGNDNTQVNNLPHRQYNSHLRENAERGAREHALWDKEHPNLSAWRDAATAAPFGIAAIPLAGGTGSALLSTTAGQAARSGITALMSNPLVEAANDAIGLGFAGKGAYDVSQGKFTPETAMDFMGLYPAAKSLTGLTKTRKISKEPFVSELDWSPEGWFRTRTGNIGYDAEDIAALNSHIPEYHQIEQQTKANGTWLKMPDGSTWQGDPRSWVQLMSKDGEKLQQRRLFHGDSNSFVDSEGKDRTAEVLGKGILWTSTNKHLPHTYGNNHYELTIPKDVPNSIFDAEGRYWNNLSAPSSYKYKDTNDVSYDLLKNDNTVTINNVVDVGSDPRWAPGRNGLPDTFSGEKIFDYYDRVFKGDDIIIGKDVPRKSLLGNNGNFDLSNKNIYKGLIPLVLGNFVPSSNNEKNENHKHIISKEKTKK